MDEIDQQTTSDPALRDSLTGDSEASIKGVTDNEVGEPLTKKSSNDASMSTTLVETSNTNGVEKDSVSHFGDSTFHKDDLEHLEKKEKTVNDSVCNITNYELSVASESVENFKECVDKLKGSEVHLSSVDSEQIHSGTENSNNSDTSDCQTHERKSLRENSPIMNVSGSQSAEENSKLPCSTECKENNDFSHTSSSEDVTTCEKSQRQEVIDKEILSPVMSKSSEQISPNSVNNCFDWKKSVDSSDESKTRNEVVSSEDIKPSRVETESSVCNFNSIVEKFSFNTNVPISETSHMTDSKNEKREKLSSTPQCQSEELQEEELISQESQDTENPSSTEITQIIEEPNTVVDKPNENESYDQVSSSENLREEESLSPELEPSSSKDALLVTDQESEGVEESFSKAAPASGDSQKEEEILEGSPSMEKSVNSEESESSNMQNEEEILESLPPNEDLQEPESVTKADQLIQKSRKNVEAGSQENKNLEEDEGEKVANKEGSSSKENSNCEIFDPQEESKSECDSESNKNQGKSDSNEIKNLNLDSENKSDSVQEHKNDQTTNSLNTSCELEDENINKATGEGNEIMDTELVNCSEIEEVNVNENEGDLKGDIRDDEVMQDSLDTVGEKSNEDQLTDRECSETHRNAMLIDEGVNQPGSSEEETITGDTTNQPSSADMTKEKEEEVCIIPDNMISGLSILPRNKDGTNAEGVNELVKALKQSDSDLEKSETRTEEKKTQPVDSKPRPLRNAAKLAGNKIKSLVESDSGREEDGPGAKAEGEMNVQENENASTQICAQCREVKPCKLLSVQNESTHYFCSEQCSAAFKAVQMDTEPTEADNSEDLLRKCSQCHSQITGDEFRLFWETMDFCNEDCLGKFQLELGSNCANCKKSVPSTSLGKYCVRFGYDIKQFCSAVCLEEYKKCLKVCSYCQKDISTGVEGFLAPVGTRGQFKDFCTQSCMEKYDRMSSNKPMPDVIEECAVCSNSKPVQVEVELDNKTHKLCSEPCFAAFKFVNNITEGQCDMCKKYFDRSKIPKYSLRLLFFDDTLHSFCSKTCMNVYILANRKIVPCNWCKVKKYNFDMIRKISSDGQLSMMCSLNCLMLYQTSVNAVCSRPLKCDFCKKKFVRQPLYHLTMSDATLRNFCSYNCVMSFQNGYPKQKIDVIPGADQLSSPIPTGGPKRLAPKRAQVESTCVPVISSVQSLASPNGPVSPSGRVTIPRPDVNMVPPVGPPLTVQATVTPIPAPPPQVYQQIITKPAPAKQMKNKSILCKPYSHTKGVSCRPHPCMKETQTDQSLNRKFLIPIPVPIYVPAPMHMFSAPFPVPVPFPLPIPVPIFIPTTRNSAKGIMKEIKKIQEKIPTDPFEAELLMMAEMVAGEKKQDPTDSESEDGNDGDDNGDGTFSPENVDTSNTFGDDMLQIALKMASELEEPAVDMESVLTSNTITTSTQPTVDPNKTLYESDNDDPDQVNVMAMNRGRKRSVRGSRNSAGGTPSKRGRRTSGSVDVPLLPPPEPVPPRTIEVEKPDANMCLKYTFGVNAWRHWVLQKNAELEKAALTNRKIKPFKPELLQLTADELNFSLCLFVKEVRKPNGTEYAPDTIYYLCLGIQQYLFENGRIDNIFTDSYYEKFTDCLDEVAKKFAALYNDSQYIVTRVEEEHLWESKQLGAHSPHVLLSTLMFFNTKHFNLVTVEEHMQLSFSHIMKHWKRNPNTPGVAKVPGSRNVLLRFYPPQSALEANSRKKKVYEQQENEENPLRCPVKLYEFYLSKCPESVKTRNDVFYLLPERSCVPDSPVWYSTMALGKEPLMKMLHRIKMVKEINIALLSS